MSKLTVFLPLVFGLLTCSQPQHALTGRRIFLAKGNVSFILPDSSLIYGKPILWPADYSDGDYGEAGVFYHNRDSSIVASVYVTAFPGSLHGTTPWRLIADEKRNRREFIEQNRGLITIERYKADSVTRTISTDYHFPKRAEKGWHGQASFENSFTVYGLHRTIKFRFSAPDDTEHRQAIAAAQSSVQVDPAYLRVAAKTWPQREYQD